MSFIQQFNFCYVAFVRTRIGVLKPKNHTTTKNKMADEKDAETKQASTMLLSHLHTPNPPCPPFTASRLLTVWLWVRSPHQVPSFSLQSQAGQRSGCCNQHDKELETVAVIAPVLYAFPHRGALKVSNRGETELQTKCGCLTL